jgi:DNA-directed RNA polymerase sigma subunit (sigma70/sigma32)
LYLDVNAAGGIILNFPDKSFNELEETCALDVADRGDNTLEAVGRYLNLTRERIRQIETQAMRKFPRSLRQYVVKRG